MSRKTRRKANRGEPPKPLRTRRGLPAWLPAVGGLAALAIVVAVAAYVLRRDKSVPPADTSPYETERAPAMPAEKSVEYEKLIGK